MGKPTSVWREHDSLDATDRRHLETQETDTIHQQRLEAILKHEDSTFLRKSLRKANRNTPQPRTWKRTKPAHGICLHSGALSSFRESPLKIQTWRESRSTQEVSSDTGGITHSESLEETLGHGGNAQTYSQT